MALDPQLKAWLDHLKADPLDWRRPMERAREEFFKGARAFETDAPKLSRIDNVIADGAAGPISGRLYTPEGASLGPGPGIVFFHGGDFMLADLESHDMLCRRLAGDSRCRVLALDYRRAPEHVFPAGLDDAVAGFSWAVRSAPALKIDPDRLAIAGDSAGANIATVAARRLRDQGGPEPALQALFYPITQFVEATPSRLQFAEGFFLTARAIDFFKQAYLGGQIDPHNADASPLLATNLAGLPPTLIVTAGFDPLRDEARAYAEALAKAGVPVLVKDFPSQVHGFFSMTAVSKIAREGIADCAAYIAASLGGA